MNLFNRVVLKTFAVNVMKSFVKINIIASSILFALLFTAESYTQSLKVGADLVNRYIWRGTDFGASPSIQPKVELGAGGFTVGFWGAYPTATTGTEEVDFYGGYNIDLSNSGSIFLGFTDYMFPTSNFELTNFNNYDDLEGAGSHFIEINAGYSGPENLPISLSFNIFVHNVQDNPIYLQLGYSTSIEDVGFSLFIGGAAGDGAVYYGSTRTFDIVNTGIAASKEIKLSDSFSLPVFGSVIVNPATEKLFYVVGISI
jgi:hypothetical protein